MLARAGVSIVALSAVTFGCSGDRPTPSDTGPSAVAASLGGTLVARVGEIGIDRALVTEIARARKLRASEALAAVVDEALLVHAAQKNGAEKEPAVEFRLASTLSRALLRQVRDKAIAAASFTDEELAPIVTRDWLSVDHPELRRVVHALVRKDVPNGRAVATELRAALLTVGGPDAAKNETAFAEAAKSFKVPSGPAVHVEGLRLAADGRIAEQGVDGSVEEAFTKGTFAIPEVFGTSDVVETTYGFHVIRLVVKTPARRLTREEKIEKLRSALIANRVGPAQEQLLQSLRAAARPELVATDALLAMPQ